MQLRNGVHTVRTAVVFLMAALVVLFSGFVPVKASTLADTKNQQAALKLQKEENDLLLSDLKENSQKRAEYSEAITAQISVLKEQMDLILKEIAAYDKSIADEQKRFAAASAAEKATHEQNLAALQTARDAVYGEKSDMEYKSKELDTLYAEAQKLLEEAGVSEEKAQARAKSIERQRKATEEAIDAWYDEYREALEAAGISSSNLGGDVYLGSGHFQWPMPGYTGITQYFGGDHRGIDIAGEAIYGKSIVAADQGTVAYAGWMGSYGYVVFLDHGNGYQTRYAHMSALGCQVGDKVEAGQVIGYVGSTGNSTGPHLHFEILFDGTLLNPFDYF